MKEERFSCKRDGLAINGMIAYPDDFSPDKKYPCMIASHGFTGNFGGMIRWAKVFAEMGYVGVAYGFCGGGCIGEDPEFHSEGDTTDMTISTEIADLEAVISYLTGLGYIEPDRFILLGESQGGFVSGLTAAKHSDIISHLVMIFPAICIPDHARQGRLAGASYSTDAVPDIIDIGRTRLGRCIHDDVVGRDPYLELSGYTGPVLLLQGLEDPVVNYSYAIRAKENYAPGQCHLQLIRSMGHGLDDSQFQSALGSIKQFLDNREEILTIQVLITHGEEGTDGEVKTNNVYFTGYCDSSIFRGVIENEGVDTQRQMADGNWHLHADYTLTGLDKSGARCSMHIINQGHDGNFKPVISTDSVELAWLNEADLASVLEFGSGGPTVRIYADKNRIP